MSDDARPPRRGLRIFGTGVGALVLAFGGYLAWPGPIAPLSWVPPVPRPLEGALAPNEELEGVTLLGDGEVDGPEDVDVDTQGRVYGGTHDGWIVRIDPQTGEVERWVETGGRPLGLHFDAAGNLIVADAWKGLLSISPGGEVTVLSTEADGVPFAFTDDLDIGRDGKIYFSDASSRFHQPDYMFDLLEARPHGRLLVYDPTTKTTTTLLDELYFANGVALSSNEDFVLVNETYRLRITRYWLSGPKAGSHDIFWDNVPGYVDGVASDRKGTFYAAFFTVRNPMGDAIADKPFVKRTLAKLPRALWPKPTPYGLVVALDESGQVRRSWHDVGGDVMNIVTSAQPVGDKLYLGSLKNDKIGVLDLDDVP